MEVIPDKSVLVFCATKKGCETTAEALAKEVPKDLFAVRVSFHTSCLCVTFVTETRETTVT